MAQIFKHRAPREPVHDEALPRLRILVVDDNEADYVFCRELLEDGVYAHYQVEWARDKQAALAAISEESHDIYVVDQQLGGDTGLDLIDEMQGLGLSRPAIMLTGFGNRKLDRAAMRAGACDYLTKAELTTELLERSIDHAIERARLLTQLEHAAKTDPLTELANRRGFTEFLDGALSRAGRSQSTLALLLIDLDGFKAVNDEHGHDVGDRVLLTVARTVTRCVRRGDLVARLGGDEFAVVLDNVDSGNSVPGIVDKIRHTLAQCRDVAQLQTGISASIGTAFYPADGVTIDSLLKVADLAMYEAKSTSRPSTPRRRSSVS